MKLYSSRASDGPLVKACSHRSQFSGLGKQFVNMTLPGSVHN